MSNNFDYNDDIEIQQIRKKKEEELLKKIFALPDKIIHINNPDDFNKLITKYKDIPIIIDFWAPWCGPCQAFGPKFEQVQKSEWGNYFIFAKLDVDSPAGIIAQEFGVAGVPTIVFIYNEKEIYRHVGALDKTSFISILQKIKNYIENQLN